MISVSEPHRDIWEDSVARAATDASRLVPLATILGVVSLLLVLGQYIVSPAASLLSGPAGMDEASVQVFLRQLIEMGPPLILALALWNTRRYLVRLANGDLWGPATAKLLGRVGDSLLWAAAYAVLVVPNVQMWVDGGRAFQWHLRTEYLVLAGLGLLLSLVSRMVRNVVEVAAAMKAENDAFV